jgi:hypothetical protein
LGFGDADLPLDDDAGVAGLTCAGDADLARCCDFNLLAVAVARLASVSTFFNK